MGRKSDLYYQGKIKGKKKKVEKTRKALAVLSKKRRLANSSEAGEASEIVFHQLKKAAQLLQNQQGNEITKSDPLSPTKDQPFSPTEDQTLSPTQDQTLSPTQDQPLLPSQEQPLSSNQDQPLLPSQEQPLSPTQDQPLSPAQDPSVGDHSSALFTLTQKPGYESRKLRKCRLRNITNERLEKSKKPKQKHTATANKKERDDRVTANKKKRADTATTDKKEKTDTTTANIKETPDTATSNKKTRTDKAEANKKENTDTATALFTTKKKKPNTFGIYVGEKLNNISTNQCFIAKKIIFDILFLAKTNNLDIHSRVELSCTNKADAHSPHFSPNVTPPALSAQTYQNPHSPSYFSSVSLSTLNPPVDVTQSPLPTHIDHNHLPSQLPHSLQIMQPETELYSHTPDTETKIITTDEMERVTGDNLNEYLIKTEEN